MAKHALLIGIDAYAHVKTLDGCVNDVRLMRSVLVDTFGFPETSVTLLADQQATRAAMLAAFDGLIAATGRDDIVVVHYAGHGSQITDREGDEPSGFDSTLMPWDTAREPGENRDITDDEIHLRLAALAAKTPFTTILIDACHSGTITRDAFGAKTRSVPADRRPVSQLPPSPVLQGRLPRTRAGASGWMPFADKYVLIAGCRDDEESKEYLPPDGGTHGALTYFLCQELRRATSTTTYRDVFETVAARVNGYNPVQHPQMEGTADRTIFGVTDVAPVPFVSVTDRAGQTVTLGAGSAQGLTVGSTYAVHPAGAKGPASGDTIGEMTIATVRAFTADAQVTSETAPGAIAAGTRAFETAHAFGDFTLAVQVVAPVGAERTTMEGRIREAKRLTLASDLAGASVRVYLLPPRAEVVPESPVPQAGVLDAPRWAVVGDTGDLLMKLKAPDDDATVVDNLQTIAHYRRVLAIDNPNPGRLRGHVSLEILRNVGGDAWVPFEPEADGGHIVITEGEPVRFLLKNSGGRQVFTNLVDIGLTGKVSRPWSQELGQGVSVHFDTPLTFPEGYPFGDLSDPLRGVDGLETVKVFVTEKFVDLSALEHQGVRSSDPTIGSLLEGLATRDFETPPATPTRPAAPVSTDDWTTVSRTFVLRRRTTALPPDGARVAIGHAVVTAPALSGTVATSLAKDERDENAAFATDALKRALSAAGVEMKQKVAIADARELGPASRSAAAAPPVELRLRNPPEGFGQVVLASDELGVVSWCFASPEAASRSTDGASSGRLYRIPGGVPQGAAGEPGTRGVIGLVGKKVFQELIFPLVDPVLGEVSAVLAHRLEASRWPYRVRSFTPDDYAKDQATALDRDGWSRLGQGRALLMVHGTFSRAHLAFAQWPQADMAALHQLYGGRVFAFDHFTLSADPKANVEWLVSQMPADADLAIDIVCHSRGGLVSRLLSEKQSELSLGGRRIRVGKVVLVGVPNAGTPLADPEHVGSMLDVFTNLMNFLPDNGVTDALSMVVEAVKLLAVGALGGLDGLRAMRPGGEFATWLNAGTRSGDTTYYAVGSNVTPTEPGLRHLLLSRGLSAVLQGANDFVVPSSGAVFAAGDSGHFPVSDTLLLEGTGAVVHTKYFADPRVRARILGWLTAQ